MSGCNRVVSQCEMAGASGWVNNAPTAGTFRVGRREARSLSERWPADPLLSRHRLRFKAIDARWRGSRALPLTLAGVVVVVVGGADPGNIESNTARSGERVEAY